MNKQKNRDPPTNKDSEENGGSPNGRFNGKNPQIDRPRSNEELLRLYIGSDEQKRSSLRLSDDFLYNNALTDAISVIDWMQFVNDLLLQCNDPTVIHGMIRDYLSISLRKLSLVDDESLKKIVLEWIGPIIDKCVERGCVGEFSDDEVIEQLKGLGFEITPKPSGEVEVPQIDEEIIPTDNHGGKETNGSANEGTSSSITEGGPIEDPKIVKESEEDDTGSNKLIEQPPSDEESSLTENLTDDGEVLKYEFSIPENGVLVLVFPTGEELYIMHGCDFSGAFSNRAFNALLPHMLFNWDGDIRFKGIRNGEQVIISDKPEEKTRGLVVPAGELVVQGEEGKIVISIKGNRCLFLHCNVEEVIPLDGMDEGYLLTLIKTCKEKEQNDRLCVFEKEMERRAKEGFVALEKGFVWAALSVKDYKVIEALGKGIAFLLKWKETDANKFFNQHTFSLPPHEVDSIRRSVVKEIRRLDRKEREELYKPMLAANERSIATAKRVMSEVGRLRDKELRNVVEVVVHAIGPSPNVLECVRYLDMIGDKKTKEEVWRAYSKRIRKLMREEHKKGNAYNIRSMVTCKNLPLGLKKEILLFKKRIERERMVKLSRKQRKLFVEALSNQGKDGLEALRLLSSFSHIFKDKRTREFLDRVKKEIGDPKDLLPLWIRLESSVVGDLNSISDVSVDALMNVVKTAIEDVKKQSVKRKVKIPFYSRKWFIPFVGILGVAVVGGVSLLKERSIKLSPRVEQLVKPQVISPTPREVEKQKPKEQQPEKPTTKTFEEQLFSRIDESGLPKETKEKMKEALKDERFREFMKDYEQQRNVEGAYWFLRGAVKE